MSTDIDSIKKKILNFGLVFNVLKECEQNYFNIYNDN